MSHSYCTHVKRYENTHAKQHRMTWKMRNASKYMYGKCGRHKPVREWYSRKFTISFRQNLVYSMSLKTATPQCDWRYGPSTRVFTWMIFHTRCTGRLGRHCICTYDQSVTVGWSSDYFAQDPYSQVTMLTRVFPSILWLCFHHHTAENSESTKHHKERSCASHWSSSSFCDIIVLIMHKTEVSKKPA